MSKQHERPRMQTKANLVQKITDLEMTLMILQSRYEDLVATIGHMVRVTKLNETLMASIEQTARGTVETVGTCYGIARDMSELLPKLIQHTGSMNKELIGLRPFVEGFPSIAIDESTEEAKAH